MRIIEINAFDNGAHRNQTTNSTIPVPEGWAVIPDEMETENFPFGEVTAEKIDGVMTVTEWTPLPIPEPEPIPEPTPEPEYVTYDEMAEAIREGVNSI